jgi:ATP-dependent Clp protease, protease subunit
VAALAVMFSTVAAAAEPEKVVLTEKNLIVLRGQVTSQSTAKIAQQILSSQEEDLYLYISSPGGSILAGQSLIYAMQTSGKRVHCIASVAISMAYAITQGCTSRLVMPHSIMMQHVASYGLEGQDPNNRTFLKFLTDMIDELEETQAARMGLKVEDFKAKTRNDWWMYGAAAVKNNAADKLAAVSCSKELAAKTYKENIQVFIFSINVTWSACPLIEGPVAVGGGEDGPRRDGLVPDAKSLEKLKEAVDNLNTYKAIDSKFRQAMGQDAE